MKYWQKIRISPGESLLIPAIQSSNSYDNVPSSDDKIVASRPVRCGFVRLNKWLPVLTPPERGSKTKFSSCRLSIIQNTPHQGPNRLGTNLAYWGLQ